MRRYLVVANQTLLGDPLLRYVKQCVSAGPCQFHLVVPATHVPGTKAHREDRDRAFAARRLAEGLERFRALGIEVVGEVGDIRPMDAIKDAMLHAAPFDEIVLSTLPPGLSKWLHQDLPHRIHRWLELPVSTVTAARAAA